MAQWTKLQSRCVASLDAEAKLNYIIQTGHVFVVDSHMPHATATNNFNTLI